MICAIIQPLDVMMKSTKIWFDPVDIPPSLAPDFDDVEVFLKNKNKCYFQFCNYRAWVYRAWVGFLRTENRSTSTSSTWP